MSWFHKKKKEHSPPPPPKQKTLLEMDSNELKAEQDKIKKQ